MEMEGTDMSDCDSDGTIVEGSVQESDNEYSPDLDGMLFVHKNTVQLHHTMSDYTSGSGEPIGGIYSPVIQIIPKSKYFRLNAANHLQQQVNSQVYDGIPQSDQSQSLLRFGMNCLSGVSSTQNSIPSVQNVDLEHNCSRGNKDITTADLVNDMQAGTDEQEIADDEDSPEINLLTGAIITVTPSAKNRSVLQATELSEADSATASLSVVSEDAPLQEEVAMSSVAKLLLSTTVLPEPETVEASEQPVMESLTPEYVLSQNEVLIEQNNVELIAKQLVTGNVDLFRPLSSESLTKSPKNMAPLIKSQFAQRDGTSLIEPMEEKCQAVPLELLTPQNRMPLFNSDTQLSAATNSKSLVHLSNEKTLGFKRGSFILNESNTQADNDLTQVTDYDVHSDTSKIFKKIENLELPSVQLPTDENEAAADASECESVENIEKGQETKNTSTSSLQEDAVKISIVRKSTRRRFIVDRHCLNLCVSQSHNSQVIKYSAEKKRKAPPSDCEDLVEKLFNQRKMKRLQKPLNLARDCKNSNVPSSACIELSQNKLPTDENEAAADASECESVENIEKGQETKNTSTSSLQEDAVKISIVRKSTRRRFNVDRHCLNLCVSQSHNSQVIKYSAEKKRKAPPSDCEDLVDKLFNQRKMKRLQKPLNLARDCKNSNVHSSACIELSQNKVNVQTKKAQFIKNTCVIQPQQDNRKTKKVLHNVQNHTKDNRTTFSIGKTDERNKEPKNLTCDEVDSKQRSSQFRKIHTRSSSQHSKSPTENSLRCYTQSKARNEMNTENIECSEPSLSSLTTPASTSISLSLTQANKINHYGETRLHIAVKKQDMNMLRALIQAGANVNLPDHAGWTPLHEASLQGVREAVQELLSAGAEVNCKGYGGVTPLQDATNNGHSQIIQLLLQHGAIAIQNVDIGKCAVPYISDEKKKRLNQQQKQLKKGTMKIEKNRQLQRGVDFKNAVDCRKPEMKIGNYYDSKTPLSLKCKKKVTSRRKKHVKPRGTQSEAKRQILFPIHTRLAQHLKAQAKPRTPHNSKPQSADTVKIQSKTASISMEETDTGSTDCINGNSQAVLFGAGTGISNSQMLLRRSTRSKNLAHRYNYQAQNSSIVPIQPKTKVPHQNRLEVGFTAAGNKTSTMIAAPGCQQKILRYMSNQLTNSNPENKTAEKIARNTSAPSKIAAVETPKASDSTQSAKLLKEYQKCSQHSAAKTQPGEKSMSEKEAACYLSAAKVVKTHDLKVSRNNINVKYFNKKTPQKKGTVILPGVNPKDTNKSVEHIMSTECNYAVEIPTMDILQNDRIRQHKSTGNKMLEEESNCDVATAVDFEDGACCTMTSEHEFEQETQASVTPECVLSQQDANYTTALHTDRGDIVITQSETGNDIVPTEDTDETVQFVPAISGHNLKETVTMEHQSNSRIPDSGMISDNELNATAVNLHSESEITVDKSRDTIGELNVNNSHVLGHSSVSPDQEATEETNASKAKEGHRSSKNNKSSNFDYSKWRGLKHDTNKKDGPSHVVERNQTEEKTLNSTLHKSDKVHKMQPAEVNENMEMANKPSTSQVISESSGSLISCKQTAVPTSSGDISTLRSINKKDGKGQSRLHLAVKKRDLPLVRSLIEAGIQVNMKDYGGWTALHEACDRCFVEGIHELLKAGADVNSIGMDGISPLHDAVRSSHYEAVKLLLHYGANPNQKNTKGVTAFDEAENDQIRTLLKTFCSGEATLCKQSQLGKGDQTPPTLQNDNGSESPHHFLWQHKSITATLDEVEKKQEGILEELKEPEATAGVELKLAQMQQVLNEVLAKHKDEKETLVKKFRVTPGSFRQDTLQKEVTALASRQKRFLNMLQKKKALDQKWKECNLKLQSTQHDDSINQPIANLIHTAKSIATDPPNSSEIQHRNQTDPVSEPSGEVYITFLSQEPGARQNISCLNQTEVHTTDNLVANAAVISPERTAGCSSKINDPLCTLDNTHSPSNMQTTNTSQSTLGKDEESALSQPIASQLSCAQMETAIMSRTDCSDLTACSSSKYNVLLNTMQCTNTKDNLRPSSTSARAQSRTEESSADSRKVHEIRLIPFSNILTTSLPKRLIAQPQTSQPNPSLPYIIKLNTPSGYQQQMSQFNCTQPSSTPQDVGMFQANSNSQCSMQINSSQLTSSQTNVSLASTAINCRKPASESLPHNNGDGQRKMIHLLDLIKGGVIQPGENVLELKLQGSCHKAELLSSGSIRSNTGIIYRSPVHWMKAFLGDDIPINWRVAWNKISYRGKELLKYVPVVNSSIVVPQSRSLLQSTKLTTLMDKTSFVPTQCTVVTEAPKPSMNMKFPCSFMQIREILLITNNELFPSHIIDQHWKHYAECDNWDV